MIKGLLLFLMAFACPQTRGQNPSQELIKNLRSRLHDLSSGRGQLIKSYTDHSQSYIYDQALAVIAFSRENDQASAKKLLNAMKSLQMKDGSLYFSYFLNGSSPWPAEGDKRIAGAMAWVSLAASHYQYQFQSSEFVSFNRSLLTYLQSEMKDIEIESARIRALRFAPDSDIAALEHNLDAYVAFKHFQQLNKTEEWNKTVLHLEKFVMSMWDKKGSHFWPGALFSRNTMTKSEFYLDNQTWTLLALDKALLSEFSIEEALKFNCHKFLVHHEGVVGFQDSRPVRRPASVDFIWSEGTLGQVLAMKRSSKILGKSLTCEEKTPEDFITSIKRMKKDDGGIAYATRSSHKDFSDSSSVAGTAWMYFAINDFNPFKIDGSL